MLPLLHFQSEVISIETLQEKSDFSHGYLVLGLESQRLRCGSNQLPHTSLAASAKVTGRLHVGQVRDLP